jgi:serine/threonine protein kinase
VSSLPETEPRNFDHYVIESILGRGAMGTVYLAKDVRIGRRVALKTVRIDQLADDADKHEEFYQRLQREAELSGSLQHPNIVTLYEVGYEGGRVSYLATEYVDGPSLKSILQNGKLSPSQAFSIVEEILLGLSYAHEKKIVHRDLKPGNVLLSVRGGAKIADFGIARREESDLTTTGTMMGTPSYMSPEQVKALNVTPQTDLFSLGVVIYEMLSGQRPFHAPNTSTVLYNIVHEEPRPIRELEPGVTEDEARFVHRLLEKKPKDRFANAEEAMAEVLRLKSLPRTLDDGITQRIYGDSWLKKPIDARYFFGIPAALAILILLAISPAVAEMRKAPQIRFSRQQLTEFEQKRTTLDNARTLLDDGKYDESLALYNAYLTRYPYSLAAQEGRDEVLEAQQEKSDPGSGTTVTKKPRKKPAAQKPSIRQRMRRIFGKNPN